MKWFVAADHAGFEIKNKVVAFLKTLGEDAQDLGPEKFEKSDDYPDYAKLVSEKVSQGEGEGILVCDTGIGMAIAANKFKGVRAALATSPFMARRAREHNNTNILVLGAEINSWGEIEKILEAFLTSRFTNQERHTRRIDKITKLES